jgi:hypothetical protein
MARHRTPGRHRTTTAAGVALVAGGLLLGAPAGIASAVTSASAFVPRGVTAVNVVRVAPPVIRISSPGTRTVGVTAPGTNTWGTTVQGTSTSHVITTSTSSRGTSVSGTAGTSTSRVITRSSGS